MQLVHSSLKSPSVDYSAILIFYLLWNIAIHCPIKYLPPEHPLTILDSITYFHVFQTSGQSPTVTCFPFLTIGVFKIC